MGVERTFVDLLQLGDDVQTNVGEVILEHLKEHGKKVGNSPRQGLATWMFAKVASGQDLLVLSKNRRQAADLGTKSRPDVLGLVRDKILHTSHNLIKQRIAINQSTEA